MRVAILLFEGVDLLDVGGPYEVFLTANRLAQRAGDESPFEVSTVSATDEPVRAYGGLRLGASTSLAEAVGSEIVVVPGAVDIGAVAADPRVRSAVEALTADVDITTSVCTGAFLLGDAGLLEGRPFTTHWEDVAALGDRLGAPEGRARRAAWVDSGEVVTAGGLACGISMALHLVGRLVGLGSALAVARQIDYAWQPA
jgi:transcriptional regulator GlxA family with amidase domain